MLNYLIRHKYLESYLFKDITEFFQSNGYISGVQFYCILIWKAERTKFKNARKIIKKEESKTFDENVKTLACEIYKAKTDLERVKILFDWEFWIATASAILTVLYPKRFTIYDFRVVEHEELKRFKNIDSEKSERNAESYLEFIEAVKTLKLEKEFKDLRSKDRYLWGLSRYKSIVRDIESGFPLKNKKET